MGSKSCSWTQAAPTAQSPHLLPGPRRGPSARHCYARFSTALRSHVPKTSNRTRRLVRQRKQSPPTLVPNRCVCSSADATHVEAIHRPLLTGQSQPPNKWLRSIPRYNFGTMGGVFAGTTVKKISRSSAGRNA